MRYLTLLPLIAAGLLCCSPPDEAEPIDAPALETQAIEPESSATCNPLVACDLQGPCTCPSGFVCGNGICARSIDPWFECYSNADCAITSGPYASTCFVPVCYMFTGWNGQPESGCGWNTRVGGSCAKPGGGNGTCAAPPNDGDCV